MLALAYSLPSPHCHSPTRSWPDALCRNAETFLDDLCAYSPYTQQILSDAFNLEPRNDWQAQIIQGSAQEGKPGPV